MGRKCIHHWHIDLDDVGRCQKCDQVKDFGKLLRRELKVLEKDTHYWPPGLFSELAEDLMKV